MIRLARLLFRADRAAFLRGAGLGILVLTMGAALLGLSGWFVTASAAAGIAGIGIAFDFFRPSAGVRFLAMGRAGARYGERMLTHDATLRALSALRGRLFAGITRLPWSAQSRLRAGRALNRLTSDVEALDGLLLRLVLPAISAVVVLGLALALLWLLVAPSVALAVVGVHAMGGGLALWVSAHRTRDLAETGETALQDARATALDLVQNRADLAVAGALDRQRARLAEAVTRTARIRDALERIDRRGGALLALTTGGAGAAALALGGTLVQQGRIDAATAAIGFFVALALGEGLAALRRGLTETGRMRSAGRRVLELIDTPPRPAPAAVPAPRGPLLDMRGLSHRRPGAARATFGPLDLTLHPGETVVLAGPSGAGKSTLLSVLAGLEPPSSGTVTLLGTALDLWPETALRRQLTMVPQRSALIGGTVAMNLGLACDGPLPPETAWQALEAVALADPLRHRDGLETRLGPGGSGLSGGQARRLCLARAALRRPKILLLDEPSEGLDPDTATRVLRGLRALLPDAAFLIVSHRPGDLALADRRLTIGTQTFGPQTFGP